MISELTPDKSLDELLTKLIVVEGDLSQPRLGLNEETFTRLSQEVDLVIHNGANVNHVLLYNGQLYKV